MALLLTGTESLSIASALLTTYPMTMIAWVKPTSNTGDQAIISLSETGNANLFMLDLNSGTPRASIKSAGSFLAASSSGGSIGTGTYFLISAVFTSATLRTIYVNGSSTGTNVTASTPTAASINTTNIGTLVGANLLHGSVAYSGIYNIALSPTDNANLYNGGAGADPRTIQGANLVSFSILQSGPPYADSITLGNWTLTGSPTIVADPFTISSVKALVGSCTITTVNSGAIRARKRLAGACTINANPTGDLTVSIAGVPAGMSAPTMVWTTVASTPVVLFMLPANFGTQIKVSLSIMDMAQVTQNNKSSTRSLSDKGRYTIQMECLCSTVQESTDLRMGLNRLKGELVALPLWTDLVVLTAQTNGGASTATYSGLFPPARYGSFWAFINLDNYLFEVVTVTSVASTTVTFSSGTLFTWPIGSILVPLIFGRFDPKNPPSFTKLTESVNTVAFTFEENSPLPFTINPFPKTLGAVQTNLGLSIPARLWNVPCTYSGAEQDTDVVDIDYERIGFGRQDAAFVYPQVPRRVTELSFELCDRSMIALIEGYFIDRRGRTLNLWVPTFRNDADLQEALPDAINTRLAVNATSRYLDTNFTTHPGYPYVCLNDNTGQAIFPFKIASIAGSFLVSTVPITQSFDAKAKISALILSRFQDSKIDWTYRSDGYAYTTVKWVEATEDYGNTPYQQFLAQCYVFTNTNPGGTTTWRYTSFESTLVVPSLGTFVPGLFSHGSIKTGLDMGSDEAEVVSFQFVGNPLSLLMPWNLIGDLQCDIYDVDRIALTFTKIFSGTVEELDTEGAKITAKVMGFGGMYDQQFHRHVMAGDCPYAVYTPECGALRTAFSTVTGTVTSVSGNQVVLSVAVGGGANAFANGIMEISGAGIKYQMIEITANAGNIFQLSRPPVPPVVGGVCSVSLGCDGTAASCIGFSNIINFGGEINIPTTNPSVAAVKPKDSTASKK